MYPDGVLALVIVMSLAVFFAVIFGALLFIIRRRKQRDGNTSSLVRDRIQRSMQGHQGTPVEADDAGFEEPSDGRSPAAAINDEQDLEEGGAHGLKDVNEFGQASSTKSRGTTYHDAHDNDSWLSSTTSSGTKSYLGGWFGLDSVRPTAITRPRGMHSSFVPDFAAYRWTRGTRDKRRTIERDPRLNEKERPAHARRRR